jgi:putative MATE family efflux protein
VDDHHLNADAETPPAHDPLLPDLRKPIWHLVLTLAWPVLVQQLLILSVNVSDRLLAGRFQSLDAQQQAASQAAQTTANYLAWVITSYMVLVSVGSTTLVAHFTGAGDRRGAVLVTNQSILLAIVVGLAGTVAGLLGLRPAMHLLQLHGPAAEFAVGYLRPLVGLLVFQAIESAGVACLAGAGDTRTGLWVLGGVAVLNLPLAWGFFHGVGPLPGMGFTGIAVGTAVSHVFGALAVTVVLLRGRASLRLHLRLLLPRFDLLRRMLRVSIPVAADSLSMALGYLVFVSIVNGLGDIAAAAHGIAVTWEALAFQSGSAFGTAGITLVGQYLGAGQPERAARSGWMAFGLGAGLMTFMGVVFFALAVPMFHLFCPHSGQQPIIATGVPVLRLIAFAMPALAACMILAWALRGAGDTRVPMLFTWVGFFAIRIPLAYFLTRDRIDLGAWGTWPALNLGLMGAWLGMFADIHVRGLFVLCRFASGRWQRMRI